jgi:AcrR family transcriptional regulator
LSSAPTQTSERPLRADARRNREKVLQAARECFAECGEAAQMEDLAGRAGVGVGTVYRHFPTKEALLRALAEDFFDMLTAEARAALEVEDPWEAFSGYMWRCAEAQAANLALSEAMAGGAKAEVGARRTDLHEAVGALIARAQEAGVMREDVTFDDVPMILCGLGRVQPLSGSPNAPFADWRRHLEIMLAGLRAR